MRLYLIAISFLFVCTVGYSQNYETPKDRKISLKFYGQIMGQVENGRNEITFPRFTPGVAFHTKRNHFHEVAFSALNFKKEPYRGVEYSLNTYSKSELDLGLRYSFNYNIFQGKRIGAYMGVGSNIFSAYTSYNPINEGQLGTYNWNKGFDMNLTPGLTWKLNEKLRMNVNVPINVYNHTWTKTRWSEGQSSKGQVFPNQYTVNFGIGLRF